MNRLFLIMLEGDRKYQNAIIIYLGAGMLKSLQIFFTRFSSISVWRGIDGRQFWLGFPHHECLPPSLISSQP